MINLIALQRYSYPAQYLKVKYKMTRQIDDLIEAVITKKHLIMTAYSNDRKVVWYLELLSQFLNERFDKERMLADIRTAIDFMRKAVHLTSKEATL